MSRPLIAKRKSVSSADAKKRARITAQDFHARVFAQHGKACYFCGGAATDAMHIWGRNWLGRYRYAMPEINGRPGCRNCHERQTQHELDFRIEDVRAAARALNTILKQKLRVPL